MTQMDLLVTNVAELLATAVHEVLRLMGQAVSESREESARMRQENQKLQHKLEELQKRLDLSVAVQHDSTTGAAEEPSFEMHPEQILEQEPFVSEEEENEGTAPQGLTFKEEKPCKVQLEPDGQDVNDAWHLNPKSPACNYSPKSRRPLSGLRRNTLSSPKSSAAQEHNDVETPQRLILNNIKVEPSPEPVECATEGQSDCIMATDVLFNMLDGAPLEDGQNHQPYVAGHPEPAFVLPDPYTSAHVLSSRVENMLDVPNPSRLTARRESAHACHVCGKTFATASSLGAHFVCHSNERPFACKCCNFRFSRLADLKKHERIHTGERPYNCSLCGRRFNRTENLRRHLRKVHHGAML